MAATPDAALETMIRNLESKTGTSLPEWIKRARATGETKAKALIKRLQDNHGLTFGYANLVAQRALAGDVAPTADALIDAQYDGTKAKLRPICERLLALAKTFGHDVEIAPKKTCVSLRRARQFALFQPSTADRVDLGIQLKGTPPGGRLEASGSFSSMVSHRVRLTSPAGVDAEVEKWLRQAYEAAGPATR